MQEFENETENSIPVFTEEVPSSPNPVETAPSEATAPPEKSGMELVYSFNGEDVRTGLKIYQRETIFRKNIIFTLILLAIFAVYGLDLVQSSGGTLSMFLAVMCVVVTAFLWYLPARHIKQVAEAADSSPMEFRMNIQEDVVQISEDNCGFFLGFGKEITKIIETVEHFLICVGKERIFILPKRCIPDPEKNGAFSEDQVRDCFRTAMGPRYITKYLK